VIEKIINDKLVLIAPLRTSPLPMTFHMAAGAKRALGRGRRH
jgi:hypothetical protein